MPDFQYMYVEDVSGDKSKTLGVIAAGDKQIDFYPAPFTEQGLTDYYREQLKNAQNRGFAIQEIIDYWAGRGNGMITLVSYPKTVFAKTIDDVASAVIARSNSVETLTK